MQINIQSKSSNTSQQQPQSIIQKLNQLQIQQKNQSHLTQQKQKDQGDQNQTQLLNKEDQHIQDEDKQQQQQNQETQSNEQENKNSKWKVIEQPKNTIHLYMIDFAQCDSKKCSGKKMERFKLLTNIKDKEKKKKFRGIVLSAFGKKQVSYQDLETSQKHGICVIDCSWNRIQQTRQFRYKHQRKLPFVIAGNPINYGKPYQLSCAQALATALCTIGYIDQAEYILSKFGWADGFWSLNSNIQNYGKCQSLQQLRKQSKQIEESKIDKFERNYQLSSSQSEGQEA